MARLALSFSAAGLVPGAFAHDLARIIGHLSTQPNVEVKLFATVDPPSEALKQEVVQEAANWSADATIFLDSDRRMPANAFDKVILAIEEDKLKAVISNGTH